MPIKLPIFDLHCDLLSYLANISDANPHSKEIGCSLPFLQTGNVGTQVLAIFTDGSAGSTQNAQKQIEAYENLLNHESKLVQAFEGINSFQEAQDQNKTALLLAIENASGISEADEPLEKSFKRLDNIKHKLLYISLTHHKENRFGGGNQAQAGLKEDGKALLDYLSGKQIAIDLSHTSDALAQGILSYTTQRNLDIPLIASHSNFRTLSEHPRNLPQEFVQELINRQGLIGINFLRAYLDDQRPESLQEHVQFGLEMGAKHELCFGADYFYTLDHPDQSRQPFYFPEHQDASTYPQILNTLAEEIVEPEILEKIAYKNVLGFIERIWKD